MASPNAGKQFRLTLLRVSETLSKKNVQDLAFLCGEISAARREELKDATDLFAALQGHDLLSENNVNTLVEWLEELRLLEAAKLLRDFRSKYLKPVFSTRAMCLIHEDLPLKYFCLSCDSKLCPDCVVTSHGKEKGCDVVGLDKIKDEIVARRATLTREITDVSSDTNSIQQLWEEKKAFLHKCRDIAQEDTDKDYLALLEKAAERKRAIVTELDKKRVSDMATLLSEREGIQILENDLERLKKLSKDSSDYSLHELQKIQKATEGVKDAKTRVDKQKELAKRRNIDVSYRRVNNDGAFGVVAVGSLIGSLNMGVRQLAKVFDERHSTGGVLLVCIDPEEPHKEYWRHSVKVEDHRSPAVTGYTSMFYDGKEHVLIAVGRTVYIVHAHWSSPLYDSVEKVETHELAEVPEESWITCIAMNSRSGDNKNEEFVVAFYGSNVVKQYNISGAFVKSIETRDHVFSNGIAGLAYSTPMLAVIGRGSPDVILLSVAEETVKQCGRLESPSADLTPDVLIWTGSEFLVLFLSAGKEKKWKVVLYSRVGKVVKECLEETCSDEFDVPISVTRSKRTGYAISSGKVRQFEY